ncbi:hypothetical protein AB684_14260 [Bacillus licheniformis]|nr:hypothetical protein AB684_14260 [Bacillus licheniformis]ATI76889.1 hypothetical protein CPQ91_13930 [Bacillus licheniformis]AWV41502.1 hypothetical protein CD200_14015 [Bacillus licheniformis]AXF89507.1 hypothetical protein BLDA23_14875 [Bacillus licheniformis]AZN78711.1 hypothetical protein CXG95_06320 [Bacillus licheniformis]
MCKIHICLFEFIPKNKKHPSGYLLKKGVILDVFYAVITKNKLVYSLNTIIHGLNKNRVPTLCQDHFAVIPLLCLASSHVKFMT